MDKFGIKKKSYLISLKKEHERVRNQRELQFQTQRPPHMSADPEHSLSHLRLLRKSNLQQSVSKGSFKRAGYQGLSRTKNLSLSRLSSTLALEQNKVSTALLLGNQTILD